tara:strand:+ start:2247 stop:2879 length:633 start_codon:yes stop_codon:yes gene_type:complete
LTINSQKQRDKNALASVQVYQTSGSSHGRGHTTAERNAKRFKVILHDDGKPTYSFQGTDTTKYVFNEKAYNNKAESIKKKHRATKITPDEVEMASNEAKSRIGASRWSKEELERMTNNIAGWNHYQKETRALSDLESRKYYDFQTKPNPNYGRVNKYKYKDSDTRLANPGGGLFGRTIENVSEYELGEMNDWLRSKPKPNVNKNPLTIKK